MMVRALSTSRMTCLSILCCRRGSSPRSTVLSFETETMICWHRNAAYSVPACMRVT